MKPRLLDLFCGAGGAAMGYSRAGFEVVGVDINPQPNYPFEFHQLDALYVLRNMQGCEAVHFLKGFDAIHASPPCQFASAMSNRFRSTPGTLAYSRVNLLTPTLELLRPMSLPWVVENVVGASKYMRTTVKLHGGMFGLGVARPRLFESNVLILSPKEAPAVNIVGVYGRAHDGRRLTGAHPKDGGLRAANSLEEAQSVMGQESMQADRYSSEREGESLEQIESLKAAPVAQLTREKIDAVIERVVSEGDLYVTAPRETADAVATFMCKFRDALLLEQGEAT